MQVQVKTIELKKSHLSQLKVILNITQVQYNLWKNSAKLLGYSSYVREKVSDYPYLVQLPSEVVLMKREFVVRLFGEDSVNNCSHLVF